MSQIPQTPSFRYAFQPFLRAAWARIPITNYSDNKKKTPACHRGVRSRPVVVVVVVVVVAAAAAAAAAGPSTLAALGLFRLRHAVGGKGDISCGKAAYSPLLMRVADQSLAPRSSLCFWPAYFPPSGSDACKQSVMPQFSAGCHAAMNRQAACEMLPGPTDWSSPFFSA
ncbi:uncharacterized protein LY79DRAFT_225293 [Colletotrichum navitas]|uniref:Uncharacterized protein n=1 Tax=Colletotrichum navitas TaxID=681940 RepID=A0AAD8PY38_9PEZI|nr:uncharacterized protein LY79DRAFT_225293 [Colletotrichum navitas]KAK1590225.1 hypothetical protein LY79DRAFT_225293 [Colletotrichum navitas]